MIQEILKRPGSLDQVRWSSVRFEASSTKGPLEGPGSPHSPEGSNLAGQRDEWDKRARNLCESDSKDFQHIKNLLDRWKEPTNMSDRVSIHRFGLNSSVLTFCVLQAIHSRQRIRPSMTF